jgi:hypothetical protein
MCFVEEIRHKYIITQYDTTLQHSTLEDTFNPVAAFQCSQSINWTKYMFYL